MIVRKRVMKKILEHIEALEGENQRLQRMLKARIKIEMFIEDTTGATDIFRIRGRIEPVMGPMTLQEMHYILRYGGNVSEWMHAPVRVVMEDDEQGNISRSWSHGGNIALFSSQGAVSTPHSQADDTGEETSPHR